MSAPERPSAIALPAAIIESTAERVDLDAIAQIEAAEFPVPWRRDYFAQEIVQPQRFNRVLRRKKDAVLPFVTTHETIAYLFTSYLLDEMHINKIATRRDLWSLGLGRYLLARAIEFASERDVRLLTLEVRVSNRRAVDFYDRHGFASVYVRREYYQDGEDALVMHKTLE